MKYAIKQTDWVTPRYIEEGLRWLAEPLMATAETEKRLSEGAPGDEPLDSEDGEDE